MTKQIDITKIKLCGIHGMKIGGQVVQMIFADPSDAITFAQKLMPTRGDVIEIIPVEIVERRNEKDPKDDRPESIRPFAPERSRARVARTSSEKSRGRDRGRCYSGNSGGPGTRRHRRTDCGRSSLNNMNATRH
jgi:hypothetical protein